MLLEFLNMGERPAFFGTYQYKLKDNVASIALTGFAQSDDGIKGGTIGIYHTASGAYVAVGATYHDPVYQPNADGTPNENFGKFAPSVELGINRGVFPRKTR